MKNIEKVIINTCENCKNIWFPKFEDKDNPCPKCGRKKTKL